MLPFVSLTEPSREIPPGERASVEIALPPQTRGRYAIEIDCVAADGWVVRAARIASRAD